MTEILTVDKTLDLNKNLEKKVTNPEELFKLAYIGVKPFDHEGGVDSINEHVKSLREMFGVIIEVKGFNQNEGEVFFDEVKNYSPELIIVPNMFGNIKALVTELRKAINGVGVQIYIPHLAHDNKILEKDVVDFTCEFYEKNPKGVLINYIKEGVSNYNFLNAESLKLE